MNPDEQAAAWLEINRIVEEVRPLLQQEFMRTALEAAVRVAKDAENPLRGNFFAAAMREVVSMALHQAAPDEDVQACVWFKAETPNGRPSRAQRLSYWVRGGLSDKYLSETLNLDFGEAIDDLRSAFDALSRATHVREETQIHLEDDVIDLVLSVLKTLYVAFLDAQDCRLSVVEAVATELDEEATDAFVRDTLVSVDEIASHYFVESVEVEDANVSSLGPRDIEYEVTGSLSVMLQWGSGSDLRRGDGATQRERFPFSVTITAPVGAPGNFNEGTTHSIDMTGWYGEDYELAEPEEEDFG